MVVPRAGVVRAEVRCIPHEHHPSRDHLIAEQLPPRHRVSTDMISAREVIKLITPVIRSQLI